MPEMPPQPPVAAGPVPPAPMPLWRDGRPLKRWRYAGVFAEDLLCCFGVVAIGGLPQCFWGIADRRAGRLHERTRLRRGPVRIERGLVRVRDRGLAVDLAFDEHEGVPVEVVSPHGGSYVWTRKRAGLRFAGEIVLDGVARPVSARGVLDDSAGYHARHTAWAWSAGVGVGEGGADVAWNLVAGIHDARRGSERAVWVDGLPAEAPPVRFAEDLTEVVAEDGSFGLRCAIEATRTRSDRLGPLRSSYAQPFGAFSGTLPGGVRLERGLGVMERHDVRW